MCLKCVGKHGGHSILDFEDVCKQVILPKVEAFQDSAVIRKEIIEQVLQELEKEAERVKAIGEEK